MHWQAERPRIVSIGIKTLKARGGLISRKLWIRLGHRKVGKFDRRSDVIAGLINGRELPRARIAQSRGSIAAVRRDQRYFIHNSRYDPGCARVAWRYLYIASRRRTPSATSRPRSRCVPKWISEAENSSTFPEDVDTYEGNFSPNATLAIPSHPFSI